MKRFLTLSLLFFSMLAYAQQVKSLQFREEVFDFGDVAEGGGPVMHEFTFVNTGTRPVKILSVEASCGCTTPDWSREPVSPGKTGFIQARFDPKGRPGYFSKSLTVTTDLEAGPVILQIKGQVNTEEQDSEMPVTKGSWGLKVSSLNVGKVFVNERNSVKEFRIINMGDKAVTVQRVVSPGYIKATAEPETLNAGQSGIIKIIYNGRLRGTYGFQSDNIEFHTDDDEMPVKSFSVYATLEDHFPKLTAEELAAAPQLKIAETSLDLGRIRQGNLVSREIMIINTGKHDLTLKSLQPNCSCVTASASSDVLKAGESGNIKVIFDSRDRKSSQNKAVTIYSNDPRNPVQRITLTVYIED